jgi:hypothetical protein
MIWEYREAYPYLQPGGLLFSDEALWNNAFTEFSREIHASQSRILHGVGFLRKDLSVVRRLPARDLPEDPPKS